MFQTPELYKYIVDSLQAAKGAKETCDKEGFQRTAAFWFGQIVALENLLTIAAGIEVDETK